MSVEIGLLVEALNLIAVWIYTVMLICPYRGISPPVDVSMPSFSMPKRSAVAYIKNEVPNFIRRFQEKSGLVDDSSLCDAKRARAKEPDQDDCLDREDEMPQIVLDAGSGVTRTEADAHVRARHRPAHESIDSSGNCRSETVKTSGTNLMASAPTCDEEEEEICGK
ncbi:unnamed protein product [Protopolystoma xenopodis]|uniref:DUF4604 domain-containing protein n=1 Tax=Protopolystoma xenopodis TaxID=117903 RepID=A0A448XIF7_9PLAT|nr:unnamed protein product [Protopolystoma xenopodis]